MGISVRFAPFFALKKTLKRPSDIVCRYGGEEFVILLFDIGKDGINKVGKSLVDAVSALKIEHKYSLVLPYVTISAGAAIKEASSDTSMQELLKVSDDELYLAKKSGRNRFCAKF